MNSLAQELDFETANLASVRYRDFYNKDDNYVVKNFTSNISEMRDFNASVKTISNDDSTEDVIQCRPENMDAYVKDIIEKSVYLILVRSGPPKNTQYTVDQIRGFFMSYNGAHRFSTQSIGSDYGLILKDVVQTMKSSLRSSGFRSCGSRK
ncbi:hypothetical protein HK098_007601 [Nowakowskiella sp. JEL0407]|nr:hypothetical protein HK098_007601 [Nowakowskiella sp. JEL0407]